MSRVTNTEAERAADVQTSVTLHMALLPKRAQNAPDEPPQLASMTKTEALKRKITLFDLPLELRQTIYAHTLRVGKGFITIHQTSVRPARFEVRNCWEGPGVYYESRGRPLTRPTNLFTVLLVCKQIYEEAKYIFWETNIVSIKHHFAFMRSVERTLAPRIQHLRLYTQEDDPIVRLEGCYTPQKNLVYVLNCFKKAAEEGTLKSITIVTFMQLADDRNNFMTCHKLGSRNFVRQLFGGLKNLFGANRCMENVKREWIFHARENHSADQPMTLQFGKVVLLDKNLRNMEDAMGVKGKVTLTGFLESDLRRYHAMKRHAWDT